jgi:hypothetical protein
MKHRVKMKRNFTYAIEIETTTLPITTGNWHYSIIRAIGNVVDSITKPRKNNYNYFLE